MKGLRGRWRDGLRGERGEPVGDVRVRLDAGLGPRTRALTRLRGFARPPAGKNWPPLEALRPVPQEGRHR